MINVHIVGRGAVFADNERALHCAFDMTQRSDARLFLDCACDDAHAGWILYSAKDLRLEGITDSGEVVRVDGLHVIDLDGQRCMCTGDTATIGTNASEGDTYEFALVNLIFPGTTRRSLPEATLLSLAVDETRIGVLLRPRPDYIDRHVALRRTKQPEVTAILEVKTPKGFDWTAQMATDLCDALSVTNGTKVNWISCRRRAFDGSEQLILHDRVTKPYSPLALNQHGGNHKRLPLEAVQLCFPILQSRRLQLDLDSRIINAWLDARIDTDYLESRALKFVIVIEMLRAIVLRSQPPRTHLDEASWEQFLTYALPHLKFYLQAGIRCTNDVIEALTNRRKWDNLNRRSFRSDISAALKLLGARENGRTIELFVQSRNKLIHEGRFRCTSEPLPPESDAPRTAIDEYLFVAGFVDRVILQSFGLHDVLTYSTND